MADILFSFGATKRTAQYGTDSNASKIILLLEEDKNCFVTFYAFMLSYNKQKIEIRESEIGESSEQKIEN